MNEIKQHHSLTRNRFGQVEVGWSVRSALGDLSPHYDHSRLVPLTRANAYLATVIILGLVPSAGLSSSPLHGPFQGTRETGLEIEDTDPLRLYKDPRHTRDNWAQLVQPGLPVLLTEDAFGHGGVLGRNSLDGVDPDAAPHLKHLV